MVISEVTGHFGEFDAVLIQKGKDFENSELSATINTKSINTDNEKRDDHLRSPDFFDIEKHPEITFVSKTFVKTGKDKYKITGNLTIRGVSKTVVLDTKFNGQITDPWGNTVSGFKAKTKINRKDFGVVWNKTLETGGLLVGNEVEVTITVEMKKVVE